MRQLDQSALGDPYRISIRGTGETVPCSPGQRLLTALERSQWESGPCRLLKSTDMGRSCSERPSAFSGHESGDPSMGTKMLAKGVRIGCRRGGCGVCRIRVLTGDYRTGPMSEKVLGKADRRRGYALACVVYPDSDLLIEPAPRSSTAFRLGAAPTPPRKRMVVQTGLRPAHG